MVSVIPSSSGGANGVSKEALADVIPQAHFVRATEYIPQAHFVRATEYIPHGGCPPRVSWGMSTSGELGDVASGARNRVRTSSRAWGTSWTVRTECSRPRPPVYIEIIDDRSTSEVRDKPIGLKSELPPNSFMINHVGRP